MNLLPLLLLLGNKNGLRGIKEAVETAERFQSQMEQMQKLFTLLPLLNKAGESSSPQEAYVDTLSDLLKRLSP